MEHIRSSDDEEDYNSGIRKKKRITTSEGCTVLALTISHAEGIDNPSSVPNANRIYKVVSTVQNGYIAITQEVYGLPNPKWDAKFCIPLENPMDCRFLYLEVIRTHSRSDPGTSNGEALVGRVRIPLPIMSTKKEGRFGLVRLEGPGYKAEGKIILSMELMENKEIFNQFSQFSVGVCNA